MAVNKKKDLLSNSADKKDFTVGDTQTANNG